MVCKKCKAAIQDVYNFCPSCGAPTRKPDVVKKHRRPNNSGCIYRLSGKRQKPWAIRKNGVELGTFASKKEAELALLDYLRRDVSELTNLTLAQLYERWQSTETFQQLAKDTRQSHASAWKWLSFLGEKKVRALKVQDYQQAIQHVIDAGMQRDICEKIRNLVSRLCQLAMRYEIIDRNYALLLELPKKIKSEKRNFTEEEILQLFYADHNPVARMILCLIYTGMRPAELFQIKKADTYLEEGYLVGGSKTEAGRNRKIPIREEILPYLRDFMAQQPDSPYLISGQKGGAIDRGNFTKRMFYPLLDQLGIPYRNENGQNVLTPNRCRHTYIAQSIKAHVAPEALTKIVGHSTYTTSVDKYNDVVDLDYLKQESKKGL